MSKVKILVMDVDGTLTDGKIYMGNSGEEMKAFDVKDGCGIVNILVPAGVIPAIITGRQSQIVQNRCDELGIKELHQGVSNKLDKLKELLSIHHISLDEVAYIGDDIIDMECMEAIRNNGGVTGCPADAVPEVKNLSDFISTKNGGNGAVRDFIEWVVV